jgi:hypothetical protein
VDRPRFPQLAAYLDALPDGLGSHPEAQAKASLFRSALEAHPLDDIAGGALPEVLVALAENPPPVSTWVPEVHAVAVHTAIFDVHFDDVESYHRFSFEQQKRLFASPLYHLLFRLVGVKRLLKSGKQRWGAFHRGSGVDVVPTSDTSAELKLSFPENLYSHLSQFQGLSAGVLAAMSVAGVDGRAEVVGQQPTSAIIRVSWG